MADWRFLFFGFLFVFPISQSNAFDLDVISLRSTLSKPETNQSLIYENSQGQTQKVLYHLSPTNNERLGFFLDINGIEIGYAADIVKDDIETKTQNFIISYRKLKHSRITFNYQTLEGLETRVENLLGDGIQTQFSGSTKSTKLELSGQHNFFTFGGKQSSFEHFLLNRPRLSDKFDWSVSIVGGWSLKRLSLEAPESILGEANFLDVQPLPVSDLDSFSVSANVGPFLSVSLPNNLNLFAEYRLGKGHIENLSDVDGLKESGDEKDRAFGAGLSWTSQDERLILFLRAWQQEGRHVETSFGDLSLVWFF